MADSPSVGLAESQFTPSGSQFSEERIDFRKSVRDPSEVARTGRRGGVVRLTTKDIADVVVEERYCLLGYWMDGRNFSVEALNAYFRHYWTIPAVLRHWHNKFFVIKFNSSEESLAALRRSPFSVMGGLLALRRWGGGVPLNKIKVEKLKINAQIHGLLVEGFTPASAIKTTNMAGDIITVDVDTTPPVNVKALRAMMWIKPEDPLLPGFYAELEYTGTAPLNRIWLELRYERMFRFCSRCGVIGHPCQRCPIVEDMNLDNFIDNFIHRHNAERGTDILYDPIVELFPSSMRAYEHRGHKRNTSIPEGYFEVRREKYSRMNDEDVQEGFTFPALLEITLHRSNFIGQPWGEMIQHMPVINMRSFDPHFGARRAVYNNGTMGADGARIEFGNFEGGITRNNEGNQMDWEPARDRADHEVMMNVQEDPHLTQQEEQAVNMLAPGENITMMRHQQELVGPVLTLQAQMIPTSNQNRSQMAENERGRQEVENHRIVREIVEVEVSSTEEETVTPELQREVSLEVGGEQRRQTDTEEQIRNEGVNQEVQREEGQEEPEEQNSIEVIEISSDEEIQEEQNPNNVPPTPCQGVQHLTRVVYKGKKRKRASDCCTGGIPKKIKQTVERMGRMTGRQFKRLFRKKERKEGKRAVIKDRESKNSNSVNFRGMAYEGEWKEKETLNGEATLENVCFNWIARGIHRASSDPINHENRRLDRKRPRSAHGGDALTMAKEAMSPRKRMKMIYRYTLAAEATNSEEVEVTAEEVGDLVRKELAEAEAEKDSSSESVNGGGRNWPSGEGPSKKDGKDENDKVFPGVEPNQPRSSHESFMEL
ncbi:hypothetical protein OROHE_009952 [Orobanche hederae]